MDILTRRSWVILLFLCVAGFNARAENNLQLGEQQIKAGLIYNFLKYTEWPGAGSDPINVCLFGGDAFAGTLDPMKSMTVNQREINIRMANNPEETSGCHLIFINAGEKGRWPELREKLAGKSILTVSDFPGFAASGGMIEFGRKDNHINASLNIDTTAGAGLRIEDRMLKLVSVVHGRRP